MPTFMEKLKKKKAGAAEAGGAAADVEMAASAPAPEEPMAAGYDAYSGAASPPSGAWGKGDKKAAPKMQYKTESPPPADQHYAGSHASSGGGGGGIGQTLYSAKEASASALSVAVLVIWTVAVSGWTGFQVIQNALWYKDIKDLKLGSKPLTDPPQIGDGFQASAELEERALWILLAVEAGLLMTFLALSVSLLWVPYIHSCRGGTRSRRTKRSFFPWACTLLLIGTAWFKLFVLSSLMNKLAAHGYWCSSEDGLDLKYTFRSSAALPEGCDRGSQAYFSTAMRRTLVYSLLTIGFHMLMYFWHQPRSSVGKAFGFIPVVIIIAALLIKPITSLMNWYFTQGYYIQKQHNFTFPGEVIVSLISFMTAVWLSIYMGWAVHSVRLVPRFTNTLLACCGRRYTDVYYEHEKSELQAEAQRKGRTSYSLRAAIKSFVSQFFYMVQLPAVFGFVSPMITYFSIGVTNWYIKADIIAGAAILAIYMLMCVFHRALLAPSKA